MFAISQVFISVSARGLRVEKNPNKQLSVRSCFLVSCGSDDNFVETDKTEFNEDCLNPDWKKEFLIGYKFSELKTIRFDVYLSVDKIGETKISLVELLSSKDGYTMKSIKSENGKMGKLLIRFREVEITKESILMQFSGKNLDKKDLFGLSDPYFVISNIDSNANPTEVYKSEVVKQSISPIWQSFKIRAKTLCYSDKTMRLKFDCYDWDSDLKFQEKGDYIGSFETTLEQLLNGPSEANTYQVINPEKLSHNLDSYKNSGILTLEQISLSMEESFLDHLRQGLQFHVNYAIDFTAAQRFKDFASKTKSVSSVNFDIFMSFFANICRIISEYNRQNFWSISGFNATFSDKSTNYCKFIGNQVFNEFESIISDYQNRLKSSKPMVTKGHPIKTINIEPVVNETVEWIEKLIATDFDKKCRYSLLFMVTSNLWKDTLKNLDLLIDKTYSSPISIFIIDLMTNQNPKEAQEIIKLMKSKKKLDVRYNIEIISVQSLKECNDWQILVLKTVRDILNRIPDHYMKYLNVFADKQTSDQK